jgi:hypothetical protein
MFARRHGDMAIWRPGEVVMDRFIRRENVEHYRELLKTAKDETERRLLLKLLAEEQKKQKEAGDKIEDQ